MRQAILGLSFLTVGLALFMSFERGKRFVRFRVWPELGYLLLDLGIVVVVALVAQAVFGVPSFPVTWRAVLYGVGLAGISAGLFIIAVSAGRHNKRSTDHERETE